MHGRMALFLAAILFSQLTHALDCSRQKGSRPNPSAAIGTRNQNIPIKHIVVIMQENHSFDSYFGKLNKPQFYGDQVDGVHDNMKSFGPDGKPVFSHHEVSICQADPGHMWDDMHTYFNGGANDMFASRNDVSVMGYYDDTDLPFYYDLANQFAIGDRYFSSVLTCTYPNRYFLMAGTAFGNVDNIDPKNDTEFTQRTIYNEMSDAGVHWKYYSDGKKDENYLQLFRPFYRSHMSQVGNLADFYKDLASGKLAEVTFIDSSFDGEDEHPDEDVQVGQQFVGNIVKALTANPAWKESVLFLTYDENGGFYDHVAPPEACVPDNIEPKLDPWSIPGHYDRLGFRVPMVAVSPFAKHHYVSHTVYDHSSILKFIETTFNLPALTARDANAADMMDLFDFKHPIYDVKLKSTAPNPDKKCIRPGVAALLPQIFSGSIIQ